MHVLDESVAKKFLEESVHFQTEDVLLLYFFIFAALTVIGVVYYQTCKVKPQAPEPDHYSHSKGKA